MGIDWKNIGQLPLKRQRDSNDRERLSLTSFHKKAAKHKGRPHSYAYQRRKQSVAEKAAAEKENDKKLSRIRRHLDAVRAYWRGEIDQHP